jgi:hypothetical protein
MTLVLDALPQRPWSTRDWSGDYFEAAGGIGP